MNRTRILFAAANLGFGNKTTQLTATLTVPEPASIGLLGLGGLGLLARRRRI